MCVVRKEPGQLGRQRMNAQNDEFAYQKAVVQPLLSEAYDLAVSKYTKRVARG
jgi:hypothetical protein